MLPMLGALAVRSVPWGKIIVGLVIVGLALAVVWFRHEAQVARTSAEVAEKAAAISAQDAARWQAAAEQRGAIIDQQNAAIEAQRVDLQRARQVIAAAQQAARQAEADAENQINQWKERARANPADVVRLGPIAKQAVETLVRP